MAGQNLPSHRGAAYPSLFQSFQKEMAQMLDQLRGGPALSGAHDVLRDVGFSGPAIDVAQTDDGLEISADVPGVNEEDLDVTVQGDMLVIKGQTSESREEKEKDYHLVERRHGSFRRHIPLGFVPEEGAIDAAFSNGVLNLKIKRPENGTGGIQKIKIGSS